MEKKFPIFKILTLLVWLVLGMGTAFADGDCLETATIWKDCVSAPSDTTIDAVTYKKITTEKELAWLSKNYANNAILLKDLDMGGKLWIPIAAGDGNGNAKYGKIFDGNHHRISNLYINAEEFVNSNDANYKKNAQNLGFIGCLTGTVKNLIIENISVYGYGSGFLSSSVNTEEKPLSIGTVVGWQSDNNSLVEGCYVTGKIITSGDGQAVGGVVGNIGGGTITNCVSYVSIDANGKAYVGGIVGYAKDFSKNGSSLDVISSCVYAGNSLSSTGSGAVGAIVGYQYKGVVTISDVVYDSDLSVDGEPVNGFGATKEGKVNGQNKPDLYFLNNQTSPESELNVENIVCALNGTEDDGETCKTEPWEMGETSLSLNGYGADGYKITFDANGGSFSNSSTTFVKYVKADYIINNEGVENPSFDGDFAFAGWSSETTPEAYMNPASKVETIKAIWNPVYTITFKSVNGDLNGTFSDGSSTPKIVKVEQGKQISVQGFDRPTSFIQDGVKYNFVGWANAVNPDPDNIENYDSNNPEFAYVKNGLDDLPVATGNMTLVAVWTTADVWTVSFFANDESVASYVSSVYNNEKATAWTAERTGYTFAGWYESENFEGNAFDFNQVITQNYNLYAKWTQNSYNIDYVMNCSDECVNSNADQYTVDGLNLSNPTWNEAHRFLGWYTDAAFKNKVEGISAGTTGNLTLYAEWETIVYEITYRAGEYGSEFVDPEYKTHGVNYTIRGNTYTRQGYTQDGWAISANGEKVYELGAIYSENAPLTLYPHWVDYLTVTHYGAVTINDYGDHKEAVIDGAYTGEGVIDIPENITVSSVVFNRAFTPNTMSTLMLPFSIGKSKVKGGDIYRFKYVEMDKNTGDPKTVHIGRIKTENVGANTPYLVLPTAETMTFEGPVTFNTTTPPLENAHGTEDDPRWEFKGVYAHTNLGSVDIDYTKYAFAGEPKVGIHVGKFVELGTNANSNPMRAYLVDLASYTEAEESLNNLNKYAGGRNYSRVISNFIDVEIEDENGVVATGKLNTVTGEFKMDCWFDLKGRKYNSKPSVKGTYYKNGKKVIIK